MNQRKWIMGLVILVVVLVGVVVYFAVGKKSEPVVTNTPANNQQTNLPVPSAPALTFTQGAKPFVQINFDYNIAKFFNIYRSTSATNGWQKIIPNFTSNAHTAVDYDYPKSANTLYYRITSVDEQGRESAPSPATFISMTSNQDPTANWKTYKNTTYGYEVKYPNNWKVSENDTQINFMAIGGQDVSLSFFVYDKPMNEAETLLPLFSVAGRKIDSRTNVTINGINWVKLIVKKNQIAQLTYHDNKTYAAQYSTLENVSSQILSTLKFTN